MSKDAAPSPSSLQVARRLLAREAAERNGAPKQVGAAMQRAVARLSNALRDAIGEDGCHALLERALAQAEKTHPALKSIRRIDEDLLHLDGVAASVETHGAAAVTAAVEAFVAAIVDVLGRLIGEEMVIQIIDRDLPKSPPRGGVNP